MRVLVTGGAGFVASHIVDQLLSRAVDVCCIDNLATGRRSNLPQKHKHLTFVEGTIADKALVDKAFDEFKPDKVVHAAAAYKDPAAWEEEILTNVLGTAHVVRAAERLGVKKIIFFQTALTYGLHPHENPISINHPLSPEGTSYAYSKTGSEQYLSLGKVPYISFRLANFFGPRNISGPLPTFYQRLAAEKKCFVTDSRRDFLYVDYLVQVVMKAIVEDVGNGVYHLSSGTDVSIKELFEAVVDAMEIKLSEPVEVLPRNPDDSYSILLDPSRTFQDFRIRPTVSLQEGVKKAVEWYVAHGVGTTYTHLKVGNAK